MPTPGESNGPGPDPEVEDDMVRPECGCMKATKRLVKRMRGGPKSTSKPQRLSKADSAVPVPIQDGTPDGIPGGPSDGPPGGRSDGPPGGPSDGPPDGPRDGSLPSQNQGSMVNWDGSSGTHGDGSGLVNNKLPRETKPPSVGVPSPIHN